jgi:acyl-coenzyme A thioesterase PaaI-like protein
MSDVTLQKINAMLAEHWPEAGCTCVEVSPTHAVARLKPSSHGFRPGGYISGPTQFAVADAALWFLCFGAAGAIEPLALTSDLSIRFLRPAQGAAIHARADLDKAGRRSVVGSVRLWTESIDTPVALAHGCYVRPDSREP